ncbi:hypothetical protein RSSM_04378 [Rhodopirellula sallentina SM41]|uniref:Uncharacterized protein n=1 Tax=Rhodopirellula sallentina SM41 TaxID=1263870 RepID=M5UDW6_9BACT|nr:hypothetical protein RSSM_04378 [Rhodopirellula sallentina SM41]
MNAILIREDDCPRFARASRSRQSRRRVANFNRPVEPLDSAGRFGRSV